MRVSHDAPTTNPSLENLGFRKEGTCFQFPIPLEGDHWKNCFEVLLKEDKDRYEAAKDEIQNLLIFAGIFSAVVTAFVVDSYKSLQPDPSRATLLLLSQITAQPHPSNSSIPPPITPPFTPSSASIRINIYWFLSLLISLSTVLVGIVTMQWLREYQHYKNNVTSKQAFALRNMRFESLKTWHVHHILTGLPLLLQAALLLFIIGILEFLLDLSQPVAVPCIAIATFALFFHGYTTISPAFQYYWYQLESNRQRHSSVRIPPPCPYKSPQAWAFHSCTQVWGLSHIWKAILNTLHGLLRFIRLIFSPSQTRPRSPQGSGRTNHSQSTTELVKLPLSNWNNIDLLWLQRRHSHESANKSDVASGLDLIVAQHSHLETIAFSSYHCFSELSPKDLGPTQILDCMSPNITAGGSSGALGLEPAGKDHHLRRVDLLIRFLDSLPQSSPKHRKHRLIWKHQTELLVHASHPRFLPPQGGAEESCPFCVSAFPLPRFIHQRKYLKEEVNRWEKALKFQLKELRLCQTHTSNSSGLNGIRLQDFLEQIERKRECEALTPQSTGSSGKQVPERFLTPESQFSDAVSIPIPPANMSTSSLSVLSTLPGEVDYRVADEV